MEKRCLLNFSKSIVFSRSLFRSAIYLFLLVILFAGCKVQRQTRFTSDKLIPGMNKNEVLEIYGKPYKESSDKDGNGNRQEAWYYKEQLYVGKWYEVNHVLHFENDKFKSLEQGKESPLFKDTVVTINH
ncbi:hypothetical protein LX99_03724 [Mucilaginibacter oryzae]|uniref:Uncharacterized protein n=1 Tax=Mucilaginibacter oryzae TaxID=468058 RepID=A0A316H7J5_9SPHI|nr:hypothetical protein [Mucilaginibacter oryzae]PWK75990.1 hypothetical protein LX99_03724 [Mucilaginibacter oryzae]